jgi:hypothetical protein
MISNLTGGELWASFKVGDFVEIPQQRSFGKVVKVFDKDKKTGLFSYKVSYLQQDIIREVGKPENKYITKVASTYVAKDLKKSSKEAYFAYAKEWDPNFGTVVTEGTQKYLKYKLKYLNLKNK